MLMTRGSVQVDLDIMAYESLSATLEEEENPHG